MVRREESDLEDKMDKTMNSVFVKKTVFVCYKYLFSVPIAGKVMEMDQKNVRNLNRKPSKEARILPLWETKS